MVDVWQIFDYILGIDPGLALVLVLALVFVYWVLRYGWTMKRELMQRAGRSEEGISELERTVDKMEANLEEAYKKLETKIDSEELERKVEEMSESRIRKQEIEKKNKKVFGE